MALAVRGAFVEGALAVVSLVEKEHAPLLARLKRPVETGFVQYAVIPQYHSEKAQTVESDRGLFQSGRVSSGSGGFSSR